MFFLFALLLILPILPIGLAAGCIPSPNTTDSSAKKTDPETLDAKTDINKTKAPEFSLSSTLGKNIGLKDFTGKWLILTYGYMNCPDVCPTILSDLDKIQKEFGEEIAIVFISLDPERDTVEQLNEYVKSFNENFIGATGSIMELRQMASDYNIVFGKLQYGEDSDSYSISHSAVMQLIDPDGYIVRRYRHGPPAEEIIDDMQLLINE